MQKLLKITGFGLVGICILVLSAASWAADTARTTTARGRDRATVATAQRMPTIPILPVSAVGNITVSEDIINPEPTPPTPGPEPEPEPEPTPVVCPDGGVANSEYTVLNCMNDIQACVNGGALPNGVNSLFNEELRNSIVNGMGLCLLQVEHCIATVRVNCENVYESSADVWLDFNARKVQPAYYAFVLRQTGLTPTQAQNTCLLLDRNTYGSSFNAVNADDWVNGEYAQNTGAYNRQMNNTLKKTNPQGSTVNTNGWTDAKRGYYARWDAEKAECLLRVAAYNKDTLITNDWWFGGDKSPAEVWQNTGSTFTCNKDLFGFALRNKTKNMAVLAAGSTVAGGLIGAWAGHGASDRFDCSIKENRDNLLKEIIENQQQGTLNMYLSTKVGPSTKITKEHCEEIVELYTNWSSLSDEVDRCLTKNSTDNCATEFSQTIQVEQQGSSITYSDIIGVFDKLKAKGQPCSGKNLTEILDDCTFHSLYKSQRSCSSEDECIPAALTLVDYANLKAAFAYIPSLTGGTEGNRLKTTLVGAGIGAGVGGAATAITAFVERNNINCRVGDDLERVGFGKSYTIGRLRDYYVKWALNLPNTPAPTAVVTNCGNWELSCNLFTDMNECQAAQFNYRPGNLTTTQLVTSPCKVSGSACIANLNTAHQYGVCLDASMPNVSNCSEWRDECEKIAGAAKCNSAQFFYTPQQAIVPRACVYTVGGNSCKMNSSIAGNYFSMSTCPTPASPVLPAQQ